MPNEVEITISATDLTGPAFASALAKMEALKKAAQDVSLGRVDVSALSSDLATLKSKIASMGIADIADVNIPPGKIMTQLQFLKRMVDQSGIGDIMDFNVNDATLTKQLRKLGNLTETIPVTFDVGNLPKLGPTGEILKIPVELDFTKVPVAGDVSVMDAASHAEANLLNEMKAVNEAAREQSMVWDGAIPKLEDFGVNTRDVTRYSAGFADVLLGMLPYVNQFGDYLIMKAVPSARAFGLTLVDMAVAMGAKLTPAMLAARDASKMFQDNISKGIPLWSNTSNLWFGLGGKIQLFAGALTHIGLPAFIGAASGIHILADGIIEMAATLIPAGVALAAFAAGAIDTTQIIYQHFVNMDKAIDMTGQLVYPLTGGFTKLQQAVQPAVYTLLGEGLQIVNKNAGLLQTIAVGAGKALDDLGARFTYAMTQGNGFAIFTRNSSKDLQGWGTFIGNVGGILGNFLKVMPGYAEIILNAANATTHFVEVLTGSKIGEAIIGIGLAAHGALLYIGLLATGMAYLTTNILAGVAAGALKVATGLEKIGASGAADGMLNFAAASEGAAALPWGWISIAAAGVGFLAYKLLTAKDAAQQFNASLQNAIQNSTLSNLNNTIQNSIVATSAKVVSSSHQVTQALKEQQGQVLGVAGRYTQNYNPSLDRAVTSNLEYTQGLQQLTQQQQLVRSRVSDLSKEYGGQKNALSLLNAAGITTSQITDTNNQHWAQSLIEIKGQADAIRALSMGTGRYAAALNALSGPQQYLGDTLKNIQSITQAQDNLMNVVTESQTTFDTFETGQAQLAKDFGAVGKAAIGTGNALGTLTQAGFALNTQFYNQVTAGQKVIDSLEQQMASTGQLTTATATIAKQLMPFAQNNEAARVTLVAMINDALGPGTVSLKNLNTWVNHNSTSLQGFNTIITESTIKAGQLANVLQQDLNAQFQQDLLKSSGATQDMQRFTDALVHSGQSSDAFRSARQRLITDLENAGLSAQQAKNYVNNLQKQVDALHGKQIDVILHASGHGNIYFNETTGVGGNVTGGLKFMAKGGLLDGFGGGDRIPAMLEAGETVIDKDRTRQWAWLFKAMGVKGFAGGGYVPKLGGMENWFGGVEGGFGHDTMNNWAVQLIGNLKKSVAASARAGAGPGGGTASQNQALARSLMPSWANNSLLWSSWVQLWNQESGWNQFAMNPTSAAYGIPQALPFTKMPKAAWPASAGGSSNPRAQENWGIGYIGGRYGNPFAAELHEALYHWYDNGGWLKPGLNVMMNGTGGWEHLSRDSGGGSRGPLQIDPAGNTAFEQFMVMAIRKWVHDLGGGDTQRAFGHS